MPQQGRQRVTSQVVQARADLDALTAQRSELQSQMESLSRRRNQLDEQRHVAPSGEARAQIEARIAELDVRSARLDGQIQGLNDQIVEAMGRVGSGRPVIVDVPRVTTQQISIPPFDGSMFRQRGPDMRQVGGIMAAEAVALVLIGVVAWRFGMKRMREQFDRVFMQQASQMNQLQQAVDVIGIEVERISEGQRYVAKMLTDGSPGAMPVARREMGAAPIGPPREG